MAAGRSKVRILRVIGGALLDGGRWSLAILPMAAVAFAGPWMGAFAISDALHSSSDSIMIGLGTSTITLGGAMQSLLLEMSAARLRPVRARWSLDPWAIARRFAVDVGLNLVALLLVAVGAGLMAAIFGVACAALFRNHNDAIAWTVLAGAIAGGVVVSVLLARWAVAASAAHVERLGLAEALQRSVELTRGHRLRIAAVQAAYLCLWPALIFSTIYLGQKLPSALRGRDWQNGLVELLFVLLGVLAALEALGKMRLFRELATVEGDVGHERLIEVFG